jgi:hypothetical protein
MKNALVVCLLLVLGSPRAAETFTLADRVGEPNARNFFLFSTSAGNYTIRHDGMGEVSSPKGMRRVFNLKVGVKGRLERVYFLEHEGDLLLLYEVMGHGSYLLRMEQTKRKARWLTPLESSNLQPPIIEGDLVIVKDESGKPLEINKANGKALVND